MKLGKEGREEGKQKAGMKKRGRGTCGKSREGGGHKEGEDDGGCQGRKTHSLSAGCQPERRRESELSLCLKVRGGQRERKGEGGGDGDKKGRDGERER